MSDRAILGHSGIATHDSDETLEAYVLARVPEFEHTRLKEHMEHCADCRARMEEISLYVQAIRRALLEPDSAARINARGWPS
jgi:anti-sigma factor RsiW